MFTLNLHVHGGGRWCFVEDAGERELNDLIQEMELMKKIGYHDNVLSILGCCTQQGQSVLFGEGYLAPSDGLLSSGVT